jgi:hypothetical protein
VLAKRISSSTLPAVASGVQHFVAARDHLNTGIEQLSAGFAPGPNETRDPDESR